jgi:hypothetical protein
MNQQNHKCRAKEHLIVSEGRDDVILCLYWSKAKFYAVKLGFVVSSYCFVH